MYEKYSWVSACRGSWDVRCRSALRKASQPAPLFANCPSSSDTAQRIGVWGFFGFPLKEETQIVSCQSEHPKCRFDSKKQSVGSLQRGGPNGICMCRSLCCPISTPPALSYPRAGPWGTSPTTAVGHTRESRPGARGWHSGWARSAGRPRLLSPGLHGGAGAGQGPWHSLWAPIGHAPLGLVSPRALIGQVPLGFKGPQSLIGREKLGSSCSCFLIGQHLWVTVGPRAPDWLVLLGLKGAQSLLG